MYQCSQCGKRFFNTFIEGNPHSPKQKFCSEECSRLNRVNFTDTSPHFFVLSTRDGGCRGVYSNEEALANGVDYWMERFPNETLVYEEWTQNYALEPETWEWCYIALNSDLKELAAGGGTVPQHRFWGHNLVNTSWIGYEDEDLPK